MKRRVVITGIGIITSIGIGKAEYWKNVLRGMSGISEVRGFDTSKYSCKRGGEINDFDPLGYLSAEQANAMNRGSHFSVVASRMAINDARLDMEIIPKDKTGVIFGTTNGEAQALQGIHDSIFLQKKEIGIKQLVHQYPAYQINANVARAFGIEGDNIMLPNACAAGNFAVGYAFDLIRSHKLESAFTGGVDPFSRIAYTGFNRLLAVAPEQVQPFDRRRKGMMVGEGAGVIYIESLDSAQERGAHIYAEILGYGVSCDAFHMTTPHPEAKGIVLAMERAMENSGITADDVDYISPHGTGTNANDRAETVAIKNILSERYKEVPVSSIKSMIGHTMGAASAIETITCALILENGVIPPTINFEEPDPECDLDCVPNVCRKKDVNIILNNAQAFGGNNSCLVLRKFDNSHQVH